MSGDTQMFLAKALFDNIAETPDELAFRRGDVLTILEQNTGGLEGWWLCSLRGRQGIAPGNRLKILSGMVDGMKGLSEQEIAKTEWRRSLEKSPNKVVTPVKKGDIYLYNQPDRSIQDYDVPPSRYFPSSKETSPQPGSVFELYDTPSNRPAVRSNSVDNSLYDTPPSSKRASSERTPPVSHRGSVDSLSNRLSGGHVYQTPPGSKRASAESLTPSHGSGHRISGGERPYETPPGGGFPYGRSPPGSKRASLERILSDDQPTYDTPSPSRSQQELSGEATYDTPSSRRQSRDSTGTGSRASMLSTASSESCISDSFSHMAANRHSTATSLDSARSSLDASLHEPYDLPPRETRALKQLSMDSGLGFYDTPAAGRAHTTSPQPPHMASSASHLSGLSKGERQPMDMKRSKSLEHALDDLYDSPRNNAPKISLKSTVSAFGSMSAVNHDPSAVYDIPPQVTRDSIISARSDSSDESLRLSSCSMDSRSSGADFAGVPEGVYEELLLDLDSALELLVKLQQDVTRAASKLLAFVSSTWRTKESLQTRVYDIKVACVELKKILAEFVEFAQGTLANSARLSDKKLISRLVKQVTPLQQTRKAMSAALRALEEKKWQVSLLAEPLEAGDNDDLGNIVNMAKELGPDVKKLASLIQGNGTLLFKRSSDLAAQSQASSSHVASKPPIGPKPEAAPKPNGAQGNARPKTLQQRPLPAPPVARPLPPTPMEVKLKAAELTGSLDNLQDYINVAEDAPQPKADLEDRDYSDLAQEYDYVQLETCDVMAQQQSKDQQKQDKDEKQTEQPDSRDQQKEQTQKREQSEPVPAPPESKCVEPADSQNLSTIIEEHQKKDSTSDLYKLPQKHTARMSADLGDKLSDVDMVPTKETSRTNTSKCDSDTVSSTDIPDSGANPDETAEDEDELKTPMNNPVNGFKIPSRSSLEDTDDARSASSVTSGFDLSGTTLDPNDKQVLVYYSGQLETHSTLLTNAIDAFFTCIENNEPPKVFISNSKFVIVTAHKLVYISDALHRSLMNCEVRNKVMHCANHVCECLKVSVQATKMAALQYPSVPAVQEMVDRVVDVSHAAHELKLVITQASAL